MNLVTAYLLAAVLGATVGAVEIFQRYRAEPFPALVNRWGLIYVLFNATMAAAFWALAEVANLSSASGDLVLVQNASLAAFGSAVVLRSKLLAIQLPDGKEVAVGPEIVIQTFLAVFDRELDRSRARTRFERVRELMEGIDFDRAQLRLPLQLYQAMQTVTEEEIEKLTARIAEVADMETLSSQDKSYLLGYYLLDLVGEEFLGDVLGKHREDFAFPSGSPPS